MCEACNHFNYQMVKIDENILDAILMASNLTIQEVESLQLEHQSTTPTLKPNPNLGEGTADQKELDYRQEIIDFLKPIDDRFKELKDSKLSADQKSAEVDTLIQTYITSCQAVVQKNVTSRYQAGYSKMNEHLTKAGVTPPAQDPLQPRLQSFLRQQLQNVEDIGLRLRGRLRQIINLTDIRSYYQQKPKGIKQYLTDDEGEYYIDPKTKKKIYIDNWDDDSDSAINDAQNNSDMLGLFGWVESYTSGFLEAGLFATSILASSIALTIEIPWETQGDDNVCDECDELEGEGPYSIWDFPAYPHFGCRCGPGDPIINYANIFGGD